MFLHVYKEKNLHTPWKNRQMMEEGDRSMVEHEKRLHKYLDRMYEIVEGRQIKFKAMSTEDIFREINKVVQC